MSREEGKEGQKEEEGGGGGGRIDYGGGEDGEGQSGSVNKATRVPASTTMPQRGSHSSLQHEMQKMRETLESRDRELKVLRDSLADYKLAGRSVVRRKKAQKAVRSAAVLDFKIMKEELIRTKRDMTRARKNNFRLIRDLRDVKGRLRECSLEGREKIGVLQTTLACIAELTWRALFPNDTRGAVPMVISRNDGHSIGTPGRRIPGGTKREK